MPGLDPIDRGTLRSAIGPNADYYLARFDAIQQGRPASGWNWPACLLSTAWFGYRGMWAYAVLNFFGPWIAWFLGIAGSVTVGAMGGTFGDTFAPVWGLTVLVAYPVLAYIVLPRYANALYFRHLRIRIRRAAAAGRRVNPPRAGAIAAASIAGAVAILVPTGVFFVAQVAYVDYVPRSHMSEAISLLRAARTPVADFYMDHKRWPGAVHEVVGNTSGKYTERLEITSGAGAPSGRFVITATMKSTGIGAAIQGKTVELSTEDGRTWVCRRGAVNGVDTRYLPAACRD